MRNSLICLIIVLTELFFLLNKEMVEYKGINYKVVEHKVPLYSKILNFYGRHYNYKILTKEIIKEVKNNKDTSKALLVNKWVDLNIKKSPRGVEIIDSHPWTIIERRFGVYEQFSDILSILLVYSGIESFWMYVVLSNEQDIYPLTFAKIENSWTVIDPLYGLHFSTNKKDFSSITELKNGEWMAKNYKDKVIDKSTVVMNLKSNKSVRINPKYARFTIGEFYNLCFENMMSEQEVISMNKYDRPGRSLSQKPFDRLFYELRKFVR